MGKSYSFLSSKISYSSLWEYLFYSDDNSTTREWLSYEEMIRELISGLLYSHSYLVSNFIIHVTPAFEKDYDYIIDLTIWVYTENPNQDWSEDYLYYIEKLIASVIPYNIRIRSNVLQVDKSVAMQNTTLYAKIIGKYIKEGDNTINHIKKEIIHVKKTSKL